MNKMCDMKHEEEMKMRMKTVVTMLAAASFLLLIPAGAAWAGGGVLRTAEFPEVEEFEFEKVIERYERASENVGKVTPILDEALQKGQAAVKAGEAAQADPTDENKRRFVGSVLEFVEGAGKGKAKIAALEEDVRSIHSETAILYRQAAVQSEGRLQALRQEFEREELRYEDIAARNREARKAGKLSDWELRKMYNEENRQAQKLNQIAQQVAFHQDFHKAISKAQKTAQDDFTLYEQFFAEASDCLSTIGDLASNVPLVARRLQLSSAMAEHIPSRAAAAAGFEKIEKTRELTSAIAQQLNSLSAGGFNVGGETDEGESETIVRQTQSYKSWLDGESVEYSRPPEMTD